MPPAPPARRPCRRRPAPPTRAAAHAAGAAACATCAAAHTAGATARATRATRAAAHAAHAGLTAPHAAGAATRAARTGLAALARHAVAEALDALLAGGAVGVLVARLLDVAALPTLTAGAAAALTGRGVGAAVGGVDRVVVVAAEREERRGERADQQSARMDDGFH
ncbi:MAG: hypothetical protein H6704_20405 [Myxococcales bacterium]|nr:hypothetical protein [Myxococcales bacterium]